MFKELYYLYVKITNENKLKLIFLQLLVLFSAVIEIFTFVLFGQTLSIITTGSETSSYWPLSVLSLDSLIFVTCALLLLSGLFFSYVLYFRARFSFGIGAWLSQVLYHTSFVKNMNNIKASSQSDLLNSITFETDRFARSFLSEFLQVTTRGFIAFCILIYLYFNAPIYILFFVVLVVFCYVALSLVFKKRIIRVGKGITKSNKVRYQLIKAFYFGYRDIHTLNADKIFCKRFSDTADEFARYNAVAQFYALIPRYLIEAIVFCLIIIFLWSSSDEYSVEVAAMSSSIFALFKLLPQISQAYQAFSNMNANRASLHSIVDELRMNEKSHVDANLSLRTFKRSAVEMNVSLVNISTYYGKALISKDISFDFEGGVLNGIVGKSGTGKSTLLDIMTGFNDSYLGDIFYSGFSADDISYISQSPCLIEDTLEMNLTLGVVGFEFKKAKECLAKVNLGDWLEQSSQGFNTVLGDGASQMSGGQVQRLAVARALYHDKSVIFFDEPTSALDKESAQLVYDVLVDLAVTKLIVVVTHDKSLIDKLEKKLVF